MAIDLGRIANKALEAAIEDDQPRKHGSTVRALAAGAAVAIAARAAASKAPGLVHLPGLGGLRDIPDRVRDRLADVGWLDDESDVDDEPLDEYSDEEPVDEADEDDEDEDEGEDESDEDEGDAEPLDEYGESDDEPVDESDEDEDFEDEDFDDEDEPEDEAESDDEDFDEEPAPELEIESEDDEDLHPEDRPPKPPRSKANAR